ncbi:hypothetical protein V520_00530 [Pseudomonas putida KG-4]|nr:hypothetical protein V520_00530 [Pseudomonas putida KG-4]
MSLTFFMDYPSLATLLGLHHADMAASGIAMAKGTDRDEKSQQDNFTYFSFNVEVFQSCSSSTKHQAERMPTLVT